MIVRDEHSDGQDLEVNVGQIFEVVLPENPTTGFRWRVEAGGEPVCAPVESHYTPPDQAIPGRGGVHRWEFRAERAGRSTIVLVLARSWQHTASGGRTFRLEVHVSQV